LEVKRGRRAHHPLTILLHAGWAFFRSYVLRAGFLDGWRGLVIAYCFGVGCFFKHMKRYVDKTVPAAERTQTPE
jgi:hypothetical protein